MSGTAVATTPAVDARQARAALGLLHPPGAPVELRAFGGATWVGVFDDHDALTEAASGLGEDVRSTCVTIHELKPDVAVTNRLRRGGRGVRAADIARYGFLPIDLDPVRPPDVSSTEEEHAAALETAEALWASLHLDRGWPHPVLMASSGNGAHLLFLIDLAPEDQPLVRRTLEALARLPVIPAGVKVDTAVHNPARVWKLYGTWARKGPGTPERPWRRAEMWCWDVTPVGFVGRELLQVIAGPEPGASSTPRVPSARADSRYAEAALAGEIENILGAPVGERNNTLNRAAYNLGTLAGAGLLPEQVARHALADAAHRAGLSPGEVSRTITSGLQSGMRQPRAVGG